MFGLRKWWARRQAGKDVAIRVKRGAALLDKCRPGWVHSVEIPRLNMHSTSCCILGQVFASQGGNDGFYRGLADKCMQAGGLKSLNEASLFGFNLNEAEQELQEVWADENPGIQYHNSPHWEKLHFAWIRAIEARL